jgi:GNAT superfamily N-acetyltransferase
VEPTAETARIPDGVAEEIKIRDLERAELARVREIDRTEGIDVIYRQHGPGLEEVPGEWSAQPWHEGEGEHSVAQQHAALIGFADAGGIALGAFRGDRLVGIGVVVPHLRPGIAQLAYLQVSDGYRSSGIGKRLCDLLEERAIKSGDTEMVVSATPSVNTVRFYLNRGFRPVVDPLPELFELEPDDVHLRMNL